MQENQNELLSKKVVVGKDTNFVDPDVELAQQNDLIAKDPPAVEMTSDLVCFSLDCLILLLSE